MRQAQGLTGLVHPSTDVFPEGRGGHQGVSLDHLIIPWHCWPTQTFYMCMWLTWWRGQPRHGEQGACRSEGWGFSARHRNCLTWCPHGEQSSALSAADSTKSQSSPAFVIFSLSAFPAEHVIYNASVSLSFTFLWWTGVNDTPADSTGLSHSSRETQVEHILVNDGLRSVSSSVPVSHHSSTVPGLWNKLTWMECSHFLMLSIKPCFVFSMMSCQELCSKKKNIPYVASQEHLYQENEIWTIPVGRPLIDPLGFMVCH